LSNGAACLTAAAIRFEIATDLRDLGCVTEVANVAAPTKSGSHLPSKLSLVESSEELRSQFRRVRQRLGSDSANEQRTTGSQLR